MLVTGTFLSPLIGKIIPWLYVDSFLWTAIGLMGNVIFGSRIFFQWIATEKKKEVTVPKSYWWLSFFGGLLNMLYAFHVDKLPVILGSMAFLIYARNIWLMVIKRQCSL
jgi:lipid-A-disaccharide synthase-like uncharacterized protein